MNNRLLLQTGEDIPYISAQTTIHQPRIVDISYIGEKTFYAGCQLLNISKSNLSSKDKSNLQDKTDFDILLMILNDKVNQEAKINSLNTLSVLSLIFPNHNIKINKNGIFCGVSSENAENYKPFLITNNNFEELKDCIATMFCLKSNEEDYKPTGKLAQSIADKIKQGKAKIAKQKQNENEEINILERYISILSVGLNKSKNELKHYTIYQLNDEFLRLQAFEQYDIYLRAKMTGAKDMKEIDHWMIDLYNKDKKD